MREQMKTSPTEFIEIPAGHLDTIELLPDEMTVAGWMLLPEEPFRRIEVSVAASPIGGVTFQERPDVAKVHPWISHAAHSGFSLHQRGRRPPSTSLTEIEVRGFCRSGRAVSMRTFAPPQHPNGLPVPPPDLFKMVGSPDASSFISQGLKAFCDVTWAIRRFDDPTRFRSVLDWGCGCGRLLTHLVPAFERAEFAGCDLVPRAIEWCRERFPEARFLCVGPEPPIGFETGSFDLIIGSSVFTHLDRRFQRLWLAELARLLEPGGLLVASVLGDYAFLRDTRSSSRIQNLIRSHFPRRRLGKEGIIDEYHNRSLAGLVDPDFYRNTYQSAQYTLSEWTGDFQVLAYIERGLDNYQDLVVLRRET